MPKRDLAQHLQQVRSFLPFAGKQWLPKVYNRSKAWLFPYHQKNCLISAFVNDHNDHVCVGETGGRDQLCSMAQPSKEYILRGLNFEVRKHWFGPS